MLCQQTQSAIAVFCSAWLRWSVPTGGRAQRGEHVHQRSLRRQLAELPWRALRAQHRLAQTRHGRREIRSIKVVTIAAGIAFPHAAQAIQVLRRTRPVHARTGRRGRWHSETVYAITDRRPHQARPEGLAAFIRGHWQIENALHWGP